MSLKSMFVNTFLILTIIIFALVACESPERQPKQKNSNKQACRYNKGPWSECVNGEKTRTDILKAQAPGCEPTRITNKKCKPACRYTKGEWSPCENGEKKRTLTRIAGDGPECEPTKTITKQCPSTKSTKRNQTRKPKTSTMDPRFQTF